MVQGRLGFECFEGEVSEKLARVQPALFHRNATVLQPYRRIPCVAILRLINQARLDSTWREAQMRRNASRHHVPTPSFLPTTHFKDPCLLCAKLRSVCAQ